MVDELRRRKSEERTTLSFLFLFLRIGQSLSLNLIKQRKAHARFAPAAAVVPAQPGRNRKSGGGNEQQIEPSFASIADVTNIDDVKINFSLRALFPSLCSQN